MASSTPFLHDLSDFKDLIDATSYKLKILPQLVEKDYWIMHCLWGLTCLSLNFELKGGTSLSKGYDIIKRFSEDIDVRIEPPQGMSVYCGKNHTKSRHIDSRRGFYKWLTTETAKISGIEKTERDYEFDNPKLFSAGIRLNYPTCFPPLEGLKEGILLEVGFDETTPNQPRTISSWATQKAKKAGVEFIDTRAIDIKCYSPSYTFVEKLQTVSTKFRLQQERGKFSQNFLRHYYDIYCLLGNPQVQEFIGTEDYESHKEKRFRQADNPCIADNEAFLLSDTETHKLYELEYAKTSDLYFEEIVPFRVILKRIHQNIEKL